MSLDMIVNQSFSKKLAESVEKSNRYIWRRKGNPLILHPLCKRAEFETNRLIP
jgi:hypothetical protein